MQHDSQVTTARRSSKAISASSWRGLAGLIAAASTALLKNQYAMAPGGTFSCPPGTGFRPTTKCSFQNRRNYIVAIRSYGPQFVPPAYPFSLFFTR